MKLNTQRTRRFILPALLIVALLGSLIAPTSQAARMTPGAAAIMAGGTVVGWGPNQYGQATIPVDLSGVTAIAAWRRFDVLQVWPGVSEQRQEALRCSSLKALTEACSGGSVLNCGASVSWPG